MQISYNDWDFDYKTAVNYDNRQLPHPPITVTAEGVKYILPFGIADKRISQDNGEVLNILALNYAKGYASLSVINVKEQTCIDTGLCDNLSENFFDLEIKEQLRFLYTCLIH